MLKKILGTKFLTVICFAFFSFIGISQNEIKLELIESSKAPISEKVHYFKLQVENISSNSTEFTIEYSNINCENISLDQVKLDYEILNYNKQKIDSKINLNPREKKVYYLKSNRKPETKLQSYSCLELYTRNTAGRVSSSSITIKQFNPDSSLEN